MQVHNNIVGSIVSHYRIQSVIGRGGMGVLYKAEDIKLKRTVALKFLAPELIQDKRSKQRFIREAQTASALDHPNICTIYEIDETEDGQLFIAMAFYEGQSLKELLQKGPLSIDNAINIALQVTSALAETHDHGIIHRDLKPANIFITDKGEVKILDFGLAKLASSGSLTRTRTTLGTIGYMAPEQFEGKKVDQRADIWSLSVLLYEMITGNLPFAGEHEQALIYNILNKPPLPLDEAEHQLPHGISKMLFSALEKLPERRPKSVREVISALQHANDQEFIQTGPGLHVKAQHALRRTSIQWRALSSLALLLLLGTFGFFHLNDGGEKIDPRYVLVTPFENRTSDSTFTALSDFTADWIRQRVLQTDFLKVADAVSSDPAIIGISEAGIGQEDEWYKQFSRQTGVGTLVDGSFFVQGDSVIFHAKIVDMKRAEILESIKPIKCSVHELNRGVVKLSDKLLTALAVTFDPGFNNWDPLTTEEPPDYEAYEFYSDGMGYYLGNDSDTASELFFNALKRDSTFYWAALRAALAKMMLGMHGIKQNRPTHLQTLDSLFVVLNAKRMQLTSYQRNYLDFLIAYREGDHYLGYIATKKMMAESPGSIDAVRECAYQAYRSRRPREAARLLSRLNPNHPLIRTWTGFYHVRALFHHLAGEDRKALRVAQTAAIRTPTSSTQYGGNINAKLLAFAALCKVDMLEKIFRELENDPMFKTKGGRWYHIAGRELGAHGKPEAARYFHEKSHDWFQSNIDTNIIEPDSLDVDPYELYLESLYYAGKLDKLKTICTRLAKVDSNHTTVLMYLGLLAAREGKYHDAKAYSEKIESLKPEPILRHEYAFIWHKRARIAGACGDREGAMRLIRKSVNQGFRYWKYHYEIDFENMRDYPPFQDYMRPLG